jgi:hypothetical protein
LGNENRTGQNQRIMIASSMTNKMTPRILLGRCTLQAEPVAKSEGEKPDGLNF